MFHMVVEYLQDLQILWYNRINTLKHFIAKGKLGTALILNKVKLQTKQSSKM